MSSFKYTQPNNIYIRPSSLQQYNPYEAQFDSDDDTPETKPEIKYIHVNNSLIINSIDRDWYNTDDTPYNFRIRFSPASNQRELKPLYENNPTIPATELQSKQGLRGDNNDSGWYDSSNTFRLAYDPSKPLGEIVDHEYITTKGEQFTPIAITYKNIIAIHMTNAILPAHLKNITYTNRTESLHDYQYINIQIDELENTQEGTNTNLRKAFAILHPIIPVYDGQSPKFVQYHNINKWVSNFKQTHTAPLNILTIKCYDPINNLISNVNDVLTIKYIYYVHTDVMDITTEYIVIETLDYFHQQEFKIGHRILIKNYKYPYVNIYAPYFEEYINREEGHYITNIDVSEVGKQLKNLISISKPTIFNKLTGELEDIAWYTLFKSSDDGLSTIPPSDVYSNTGKIININMQTTFFLTLTTKERDASIIPSNLV